MKKSIHITIFCDEVKNQKIHEKSSGISENWDYIGVLIVPTDNISTLAYKLNSMRCPNFDYNICNKECKFHKNNMQKIHYLKYSNTTNFQIADRWCNVFLDNNVSSKKFYTYVLGINTVKIDKKYFRSANEETNVENNIYNRFFRTALKYPIKSYFPEYDEIIIDNIYHDSGNMDYHPYFRKQPIRNMNNEIDNVCFNCDEITLLKTTDDNCMEDNSVMLQFIDLFLGATMNCLHHGAGNNKERISRKLLPIIKRITEESTNKNGRYYKIYGMSFFPKNTLYDDDDWIDRQIKRMDNFYNNRELKICVVNQLSLF